MAERKKTPAQMTVVFSTYQSIDAVAEAQKAGLPEFDLIICDEAHRTTGVTLSGEDESRFVKVHDADFIKGRKRLYMTATPRVYGDEAKVKASQADAELCSMDNVEQFGAEFHRLGFGFIAINARRGGHVEAFLSLDEIGVVDFDEMAFVLAAQRDAGGAVRLVADNEIEFRQPGLLRLRHRFDGLVGGEKDGHLRGRLLALRHAVNGAVLTDNLPRGRRSGKGEVVGRDVGLVVVPLADVAKLARMDRRIRPPAPQPCGVL